MNRIRQFLTKENLIGFVIVAVLFRLSLFLGDLPGMQRLELSLGDAKMRTYRNNFRLKNTPIVVVDIDDDSYEALAAIWPWPRSYYARLIHNLNRAGARAIGIDIMLDKARMDYPAEDDSLARVLRQYDNVYLAAKAQYEEHRESLILPYKKFLEPNPENWGFINVTVDIDGVVREYHRHMRMPNDTVPAPSLATKLAQHFLPGIGDSLRALFRIAYPGGKRTFPYRPFYQVIDDSTLWTRGEAEWNEENNWFDTLAAEGIFKDKIVLVGASIEELHDLQSTPFSELIEEERSVEVPGVEVHAAALHTLLNGFSIRDAPPYAYLAILVVICLIIYALGITTRIWVYILVVVTACAIWAVLSYKAYDRLELMVPTVVPLFCLLTVSATQQAYLFYLEQLRRKRITGMFGQYIPKEVVRELIKDPGKMRLGGERRELSVIFTDIQGFTTISEQLSPENLVELLNEYLTAMTEIIHENGGIIDKYEGDAIMAEFGIPLELPDHAQRACRTAFAMRARLHQMREQLAAQGRPELIARMGIGSGPMVFGNMGSNQSFDYTVMGDVVNLASRLEGANKEYGTLVMINHRTYELCKDEFLAREMDLIRVKGKSIPVQCYHLIAPRSSPKATEIEQVIAAFSKGISLYRSQEWDNAMACFKDVHAIWHDDAPARVYLERCQAFKQNPPAADWDGIFTMTSK